MFACSVNQISQTKIQKFIFIKGGLSVYLKSILKKMRKDIIKQMRIEDGYLIYKMVPQSQCHIANFPSKSIFQVNHNL